MIDLSYDIFYLKKVSLHKMRSWKTHFQLQAEEDLK